MKRTTLFVLILMTASIAAAQQHLPPGKWWQRPEVIRELELTNEQRDRLDEIFRGAANGLIDAKGDVEKLQIAMRGEIERPQTRRAEVLRIAKQLNEARGRLFEREVTMLLDMRAVMNEEQWDRMRQHLDRIQQQRRPRQPKRP